MEADTKTLANRIRVRKHHARRVVRNNPIRIPANLHMITPCRWVARHLGNIYAIQIGDPSARGNPMPKRIHERLAKLIPAEARQTAYASILRGLNDWHPVIIRQSRTNHRSLHHDRNRLRFGRSRSDCRRYRQAARLRNRNRHRHHMPQDADWEASRKSFSDSPATTLGYRREEGNPPRKAKREDLLPTS